MKNHIARSLSAHFAAALTLAACVFFAAPNAQAKTKLCYLIADDFDRDGYANRAANTVEVTVDELALTCPQDRYVDKAGDCNDFNAAVHPRTREIGYNGADDNCNGLIDEPVFTYYASGVNNTTSGFTITFRLNNTQIRDAAIAGRLWVQVEYMRLSHSAQTQLLRAVALTSFTPGYYASSIEVRHADAGTVFGAWLHFFELDAGGVLRDIGPSGDILNDGVSTRFDTERYYTMTDSAFPEIHNRFLMVLKALAEYNSSEFAEVGYRGTVDPNGTRYGAGRNRRWCSEFYVWSAAPFVDDIRGLDSYDDLIEFFDDHNALLAADRIIVAKPGDYLPLDTDQNGRVNHSGMFLAYDYSVAQPRVWILEGNNGNTVDVVTRRADWDLPVPADKVGRVFTKLGSIRSSMWR